MNTLLMDEYPLLIMRKLATKIGLNESIILQQIHYWNEINKKANNNYKDGYYWTYNSYEKWQEQFPFWSLSTIKRTIKKLEEYKLIVSGNYNKLKIDRTKWYRIDYEMLESVDNSELFPLGQNEPIKVSTCTNQSINLNKPLPEINTDTKTENKNIGNFDEQNPAITFKEYYNQTYMNEDAKLYINIYEFITGKINKYKESTWDEIVDNLSSYVSDLEYEDIKQIVDKYLATNFETHTLYHSSLENVLSNRLYECGVM